MLSRLLALVFIATLAACGGGSGSGGGPTALPTVAPTNPPATTYTVSLKVSGGAMGAATKDIMRQPMDAATPGPLQMTAPDSTDPLAGGGTGASGVNMYVEAQVSPAPSAPPPVTYSATNPNVQFSPGPTPAPGSGDTQASLLTVTKPGTADATGTFTAAVGGPVNTTITRKLIIYPGLTLYQNTGAPNPTSEYPGYTVTGGNVVGTNDVTQADIWLDVPAAQKIHTPYGSTLLSNAASFAALTPSQWANSFTSVNYGQLTTRNADLSLNNILLFKGKDGTVCEYMVITTAGGSGSANGYTNGPVQCHGTSINGF